MTRSLFFSSILLITLEPEICLAFQEHGALEGLYIHQLAHICFGSAMLWLFFMIRRSDFWLQKWWKAIAFGGLILAFWNVMTFVGHMLGGYSLYCHTSQSPPVSNYLFWLWYFTKFDTVACCMSMLFFYLGLKRLSKSISEMHYMSEKS